MSRQTYETRTMQGNGQYLIRYMAEGFRPCRKCDRMIKYTGKFCPVCGFQLRCRLRSLSMKETQARIADFLASYKKQECSRCGSKSSRKRQGKNGLFEVWISDGNGGHICYPCYHVRRKEKAKGGR